MDRRVACGEGWTNACVDASAVAANGRVSLRSAGRDVRRRFMVARRGWGGRTAMKRSPTRAPAGPLARRNALLLTVAFWSVVYVIYTLRSFLVPIPVGDQLLPRVLNCSFGACLCGALYLFLGRQLNRKPWVLLIL